MWWFLLWFFQIFLEVTTFTQNDYVVVSERFELMPNPKYFEKLKYVNYKYNRTIAALNVSARFLVDFGNSVSVKVQMYKFASNEYRTFPVVFESNVCDGVRSNIFGIQNIYTVGCGHVPRCPAVKGDYYICKWQPNYHKFPPFIPTGSYRTDFNFTFKNENTMFVQWYGTVKRFLA